ncbi:uncharacterized protein LOC117790291 [Drosophila innubila]|uniref:uncharacterized protein LOC117790291 n=1 Tax=Drosophila innubila TaxID=198719 RepID=UPI00148BA92E|nr:uncharacterized protein LOC117790291 [Drosophila innubila]
MNASELVTDNYHSIRLLYYFSKLWDLWGNFNLHLTTYIERGYNEYFAGFCSVQWFAPPQRRGRRVNRNDLDELDELEDLDEEVLEFGDGDGDGDGQDLYRWLHMSCIFRASYFGNRTPN